MIWQGIKRRIFNIYHFVWHKPFYAVRNSDFVWKKLNREGIDLFSEPNLNDVQMKIFKELNGEGISTIGIEELFGGGKFEELRTFADILLGNAESRNKKKFLQFLFDRYPVIDLQNPFVNFVLDEKILDIANSYLGMYSKFRAYTLNLTKPIEAGMKEVQSQRWHRDSEDRRLLKVFLYLTDVDESSGPFTYVKNSHFKGRWKNVFPQDPPYGSYPPDRGVEKIIPQEYVKISTGGAGTIIFCDTSGLHKGGFARSKERLMFTGVYTSKGCVNPLEYTYPERFDLNGLGLSEKQKYALKNF